MNRRLNVLFVCSKNQLRSPTAEAIYRDDERISVRSRGTSGSAARPIRSGDLTWADLVLVMEQKHRSRLKGEFLSETDSLQIEVLHIPDVYSYMSVELIQLIRAATDPIIDEILARRHNEN